MTHEPSYEDALLNAIAPDVTVSVQMFAIGDVVDIADGDQRKYVYIFWGRTARAISVLEHDRKQETLQIIHQISCILSSNIW